MLRPYLRVENFMSTKAHAQQVTMSAKAHAQQLTLLNARATVDNVNKTTKVHTQLSTKAHAQQLNMSTNAHGQQFINIFIFQKQSEEN
jgi:hypothetical protein